MFGQMMQAVAQDFVKYIMHAQVAVAEQEAQEADLGNVQYTAPSDPSEAPSTMAAAARAQAQIEGADEPARNFNTLLRLIDSEQPNGCGADDLPAGLDHLCDLVAGLMPPEVARNVFLPLAAE